MFLACVLLALACSWPALYGVRLASFWPFCYTGVVFLHVCPALSGLLLARSVGSVLSGSGLLCPGRGQNIVHF